MGVNTGSAVMVAGDETSLWEEVENMMDGGFSVF